MGLLEQAIEEFKTLAPEQLAAAAAYIHRLVVPERLSAPFRDPAYLA